MKFLTLKWVGVGYNFTLPVGFSLISRISNFGRIVCKTYIFKSSNHLSYKTRKQNKTISLTWLSQYCFG